MIRLLDNGSGMDRETVEKNKHSRVHAGRLLCYCQHQKKGWSFITVLRLVFDSGAV